MTEYAKPRARKGMVCWFAQWDRDGALRQALYRPKGVAAREAVMPPPIDRSKPKVIPRRRSAIAAELRANQGSLDL